MNMHCIYRILMAATMVLLAYTGAPAAGGNIRVLFVGGDWKSQLPNFHGNIPLRGYFVKQEVEKAAPGQFEFTLWTSYEFLQYGESESLRRVKAMAS